MQFGYWFLASNLLWAFFMLAGGALVLCIALAQQGGGPRK